MTDELAALRAAYAEVVAVACTLDEPASWQPSGCTGWAVRDLVFHLLCDAQRGLVALATPATGEPDRDAVTYWRDAPGREDPDSGNLRATRTMASAWRLAPLVDTFADTARAVLTVAQRTDPDARVATQGHVLRVQDLCATLAVEAAVHHLDLVAALDRPGPGPVALALVRRTLDGLLGRPVPVPWDDETWARAGTGRRELTPAERQALGADADRLPLLR
ncbi:MAG TPA: maleylpyruvate isomerase N-terminal domain-containing protein [Pilimelia sp.]|nr:maleylpyruvate isomerase N-terminal domain-containing protein [Pilimelia sp.]